MSKILRHLPIDEHSKSSMNVIVAGAQKQVSVTLKWQPVLPVVEHKGDSLLLNRNDSITVEEWIFDYLCDQRNEVWFNLHKTVTSDLEDYVSKEIETMLLSIGPSYYIILYFVLGDNVDNRIIQADEHNIFNPKATFKHDYVRRVVMTETCDNFMMAAAANASGQTYESQLQPNSSLYRSITKEFSNLTIQIATISKTIPWSDFLPTDSDNEDEYAIYQFIKVTKADA